MVVGRKSNPIDGRRIGESADSFWQRPAPRRTRTLSDQSAKLICCWVVYRGGLVFEVIAVGLVEGFAVKRLLGEWVDRVEGDRARSAGQVKPPMRGVRTSRNGIWARTPTKCRRL